MADIASELANKGGISVEAAQKGLGVLLGLFKSKLPADTFSKISAAIPGAAVAVRLDLVRHLAY